MDVVQDLLGREFLHALRMLVAHVELDARLACRHHEFLHGNFRFGGEAGVHDEKENKTEKFIHAVPPTVSPSMRIEGCPTPTGTLWPSLPQVPMPVSSARS